jgi:hypothetical protein
MIPNSNGVSLVKVHSISSLYSYLFFLSFTIHLTFLYEYVQQTLHVGSVQLDKQSHQGQLELVLKDLFSANSIIFMLKST